MCGIDDVRASIAFMHSKVSTIPDNIVLIGPMGSGKTTVGRRLAELVGKQFTDCDLTLEQHLGVNIALVFDLEGEQGFRRREQLMIKELCQQHNTVLATGGGSVLNPDNRKQLQAFGLVVYLKTSVEQQLLRLARDKSRPLLQRPDREEHLQRLAEERNPIYAEMSDVTVVAQNISVELMAEETLAVIYRHCGGSRCVL